MFKCEICDREFKSLKGLAAHIAQLGDHPTLEEYYNLYLKTDENIGKCATCGKNTTFMNLKIGYCVYCSIDCGAKNPATKDKKKRTCLDRFGETTNLKTQETKDKIKETCLEKYGAENVMQCEAVKARLQETFIKKYGVSSAAKVESIKAKRINTLIERYGVDNPLKNEDIKNKVRETVREKYGEDSVFKVQSIKEKILKSNIEKYGVSIVAKTAEVKEKISAAIRKKFGVDWAMQSPVVRQKSTETCLEKYGVDNVFKSDKIKQKIVGVYREKLVEKIFNGNRLGGKVLPKFEPTDVSNCADKYEWECCECGTSFTSNLRNGAIPRCPTCYPIKIYSSRMEDEISAFCESLGLSIERNIKTVIPPYELDIFIHEKNIAIECDGLYWHSEIGGNKDKNYHLAKTDLCEELGIQLIHIFEDEWLNKQSIVESILSAKFNKIDRKIYARKCSVVEVEHDKASEFLNDNHIQGSINGVHLGLMYNDEVVSLITIGKSRYDKKYDIEILRFCNKLNTIVVGGFSKLFKHVKSVFNDQELTRRKLPRFSASR